MDYDTQRRWIAALSTVAIEDNQWAIDLLKLKDTDKNAFVKELMRLELTKRRR